MNDQLTGKTRYRTSLFGKLILQVEEECTGYYSCGPSIEAEEYVRWRDATIQDLTTVARVDNAVIPEKALRSSRTHNGLTNKRMNK